MENGKIYVSDGILCLFDRKMYVGMNDKEFIDLFYDVIISNNTFININGEECTCIKLIKTEIYGISSEVQIFFIAGRIYKFKISLDANDTKVQSKHIGFKLFQDKVMETAFRIKEAIEQQYNVEVNGDNKFFIYAENGKRLFSSIDRDRIECYLILEYS